MSTGVIKILRVDNIELNTGMFEKDLMIKNRKNSIKRLETNGLNKELSRLIDLQNTLFPEEIDSTEVNPMAQEIPKTFDYVQSINQYFYSR